MWPTHRRACRHWNLLCRCRHWLDIETVDKPLELFDVLNLIQKDIVWLVFDQQIFDMGVNLVDVANSQRIPFVFIVRTTYLSGGHTTFEANFAVSPLITS